MKQTTHEEVCIGDECEDDAHKAFSPTPSSEVSKPDIQMDFLGAMTAIMGGKKVTRKEWDDESEYGLLKDSFLTIHRKDKFHTWIVSEGDMLAQDWVILK